MMSETIEEMAERLYNTKMLPPMDPFQVYDNPGKGLTEEEIYEALEQGRKEAEAFEKSLSHQIPHPGRRYK